MWKVQVKTIDCMWNIQRMPFYVENLHHYNNFFGSVGTLKYPDIKYLSDLSDQHHIVLGSHEQLMRK